MNLRLAKKKVTCDQYYSSVITAISENVKEGEQFTCTCTIHKLATLGNFDIQDVLTPRNMLSFCGKHKF